MTSFIGVDASCLFGVCFRACPSSEEETYYKNLQVLLFFIPFHSHPLKQIQNYHPESIDTSKLNHLNQNSPITTFNMSDSARKDLSTSESFTSDRSEESIKLTCSQRLARPSPLTLRSLPSTRSARVPPILLTRLPLLSSLVSQTPSLYRHIPPHVHFAVFHPQNFSSREHSLIQSSIGDSKSTTQKLSDETSSATGSASDTTKSYAAQAQDTLSNVGKQAQDTANDLSKKAQDNSGSAGETGKTYLEQAQDLAASALNTASKTAQDAADYVSGTAKDASK